MKYNVYWKDFEDNHGEWDLINSFNDFDSAYDSIKNWWKQNNFIPEHVRIIGDINIDDKITIVYGPYFKFYQIKKEEVNE